MGESGIINSDQCASLVELGVSMPKFQSRFIAAKKFGGARAIYVFKLGAYGLGYYLDLRARVSLSDPAGGSASSFTVPDPIGVSDATLAPSLQPPSYADSDGLSSSTPSTPLHPSGSKEESGANRFVHDDHCVFVWPGYTAKRDRSLLQVQAVLLRCMVRCIFLSGT